MTLRHRQSKSTIDNSPKPNLREAREYFHHSLRAYLKRTYSVSQVLPPGSSTLSDWVSRTMHGLSLDLYARALTFTLFSVPSSSLRTC